MRTKLWWGLGLICLLAAVFSLRVGTVRGDEGDEYTYLPLVRRSIPGAVADHTTTDISKIPDFWLGEARKMVVHYAHTSHGSQVLSGLTWLDGRDARYNVAIKIGGLVELPSDATALRIYDGNNYSATNYITPEMYWETPDGLTHTQQVLNTEWFTASLWTWCGQMSYYSDTQIQNYLAQMVALGAQYPGVDFVYYTGHTDGSTPGSTLWRHNDMVRDHVEQNGLVLFDFADIESYDPAGTFYADASDACEWCDDWCSAHPADCASLPSSCAHSHPLQCKLKGQAFWWLLARMAGWDGLQAP